MTEDPISKGEPEESPASQPEGEPAEAPPIVFVSYTHETPEHKNWVKTLATDLVHNGVDALLDAWEVRLGSDLPLFMNKIRTSDRVLLICTPTYARKSNEGEGGVGYEGAVITGELAKSINTSKFVCVLRTGESKDAIPIFAEGRLYIDFRDDSEYEVCREALLRDLLNAPADPKPPLGKNRFKAAPLENTEEPEDKEPHAALIHQAERLLSNGNMLGWKRLLHQERQAIHPRLAEWRNSIDPQIKDEAWRTKFEEGVQIAEPLMMLALTAVSSNIEGVRNQTALLDDLLHPPDWAASGWRESVYMPRALAYLYHHYLGAFLISSSQHTEALRLLGTLVRHVGETSPIPLIKDDDMAGWVLSLGGNAVDCWHYLRERYTRRDWLSIFFRTEKAFHDSLRAYALLASTLRLSHALGEREKARSTVPLPPPSFGLPMFLSGWKEDETSLHEIVQLAIPERPILEKIAQLGKTDVANIQEVWDSWLTMLIDVLCGDARYRLLRRRLVRQLASPPTLPTA